MAAALRLLVELRHLRQQSRLALAQWPLALRLRLVVELLEALELALR